MIEPTVGRVVLYTPAVGEGFDRGDQERFAALIAAVNANGSINLAVFDASGNSHSRQSVPLQQPGDIVLGAHAEWMGYQLGQAAKYEAVKEQLDVANHNAAVVANAFSTQVAITNALAPEALNDQAHEQLNDNA